MTHPVLSADPADTHELAGLTGESAAPDFRSLGLPANLVAALERRGVTSPFPIQAAAIPDALAGRDVLGCGRTGSGKTLAFGLPLLLRAAGRRSAPQRPTGLVLVPTRELAHQVRDNLEPYAHTLGVRLGDVVGGTSMQRQINELRRGVDILVATPGRLHDLIERRVCSLNDVELSVLDEADQMCDMGFMPQVTQLLDDVRVGGQTMLFSATLDGDVDKLVRRYLTAPVTHSVDPPVSQVTTMEHHVLRVLARDKSQVVTEIGAREGRTLMFVRTKHRADRITEQLNKAGVAAAALHGGKTQGARTKTLARFKDGRVNVLVATDVAARGIHVTGIDLVLNVDLPAGHKDYLHRGGRTARAGENGSVVTIVLPNQRREARKLLDTAGIDPQTHVVNPGDELLGSVTGARQPSGVPWVEPPEPVRARRPGGRGPRTGGGGFRRGGGRRDGAEGGARREYGDRPARTDDRGGVRTRSERPHVRYGDQPGGHPRQDGRAGERRGGQGGGAYRTRSGQGGGRPRSAA
ncbi:DEAD/DEAH box helicase [Allonocardiopsis opalescens]|uniref:Superfamily II DNA/RNA helicase n=1 Tax=Allonocardiopsis opalescens TaxID=1144618 RepID=A0A2T0Q4A7_9ACTN|nr:DEAD/DEAH box helicase [Allonocardiopsis opalescens]PRX98593.1 superfamily II DNA/RNA helicase [Allonocardiopsis opalescens]